MNIGFCRPVKSIKDTYVYVRLFVLYADDMITAGKTPSKIHKVNRALKKVYKIKGLNKVKFALRMEINHDRTTAR